MGILTDATKFAIDKGKSAAGAISSGASSLMGSVGAAKTSTISLVKTGTNKIKYITDSKVIVTSPKTTKETQKGKPLPPILGYPPEHEMGDTSNALINSSLVLEITPCKANMQSGTTLFTLKSAMDEYTEELRKIGYEISDKNVVKIRVEADVVPSETFTNDYGDSFLAKMTEVASTGISDLTQIVGAQSGPEALKTLSGELSKFTAGVPLLEGATSAADEQFTKLNTWYEENKNTAHGAVGMIGAMLGGGRVDFPQVWKNSGFSTSYSVTVKLYNPSTDSDNAIEYFLIGPLAAILLLGLPRIYKSGENMRFYTYPYFHKIKCKGLFEIEQGAIQSISVTKGTENQIGFNQRLGYVEVKIDFVQLHAHMVGSSDITNAMPTLMGYINNLKEKALVKPMYNEYDDSSEGFADTGPFADSNMSSVQNDPMRAAAERINEATKTISTTLSAINPPTLKELPSRVLSSLEPVAPDIVATVSQQFQSAQLLKASISKARSTTISQTLAAKSRILRAKNSYIF
jgi:hypothetical protein